jgi:short-subunit dehydrogenase
MAVLVAAAYWWYTSRPPHASCYSHLTNKTALICDASGGVGAELARHLATHHVKLMLVTRTGRSESLTNKQTVYNKEGKNNSPQSQSQISAYTWSKLVGVRDEAVKLGSPQVEILSYDYGNVQNVHTIIDQTVDKLGGLDFLVLNQAEIARGHLLKLRHGQTPDFVGRTFSVNTLSPIEMALRALPHLEESKGHVFVASSTLSVVPKSGLAVFSATKHAVNGFFYSLQRELKERKSEVSLTVGELGEMTGGDKMPLFTLPDWLMGEMGECVRGIVDTFITRPRTFTCPTIHPSLAKLFWYLGRI